MIKHRCVFQLNGFVRLLLEDSNLVEIVGEYYGPHCRGQDWLFIFSSPNAGWIKAGTRAQLGEFIDDIFNPALPKNPDLLREDQKCYPPVRPDLVDTPRMLQDESERRQSNLDARSKGKAP